MTEQGKRETREQVLFHRGENLKLARMARAGHLRGDSECSTCYVGGISRAKFWHRHYLAALTRSRQS